MRSLSLLAPILALLLPVSAARAAGGDLVWTFQGIENINCMDEIEDQDSDGVPDVIVQTYDPGASGDHTYCLSGGAAGPPSVTIWSVAPPGGVSSGGGSGDQCLHTSPDLSGDGIQDVLLGTAWGGRTAYGLDGTNGAVLWDFDTYTDKPPEPPTSGWVFSLSWVPDVDGDGTADVFFSCGSDNNRAYHVSGDDGAVIWSVPLGDAVYATATLDDVTGDGVGDVAAAVGDFITPAVWCLRGGATNTPVVWSHPMPSSAYAVERIADLDGDSINDVLVGTWAPSVFAFSGASGDTLWRSNVRGPVMRLATLDDVDGDGYEDVVVGSWADATIVLSGLDGAQVWSAPAGDNVWAVGRVEDVNFDGTNDVVSGSFDGNVYVLDGVTGAELWSFATGDRLLYVQGVSDLTGNNTPDVIAGTQMLDGVGGRAYLLEGGPDSPATPAGLPLLLSGRAVSEGIELELANARYLEGFLERTEGPVRGAAAVASFRRDLLDAHRRGELSATDVIRARDQDPRPKWTRVGSGSVAIPGGAALFTDRTAAAGVTYSYRVAFVSEGTVVAYSPVATVTALGATGGVPVVSVRPNPVSGDRMTIELSVREAQPIRVEAYDVAGRRAATIDEGTRRVRDVRVTWDGRDDAGRKLPAGVYFVRAEGRDFVSSGRVTILR